MSTKSFIINAFLTSVIILTSCVENEPKIEDIPNDKIAFEYAVVGDYKIDYYVGSQIQFSNTSTEQGVVTWNFGDGSPDVKEPNPLHKYTVAGKYEVTLTIEGVGHRKQVLLISEITPIITTYVSSETCLAGKSEIHFSVELPNPDKLDESYEWVFPEGTTNLAGEIITSSLNEDPGKIRFKNIGSQGVILRSKLSGRALPSVRIDVPVGYETPSKNLYYAAKGGNLMMYKLINGLPNGVKNMPFDLGVKSGQHPLNIIFNDTSLYVLDGGKKVTWQDDVFSNLGDGRIFVVSKDGKVVETMLDNEGGKADDDPFCAFIEPNSKVLHFTDRNTGITQIPLDKRNEKLLRSNYPFWVQNNRLGYYGLGIGYGCGNASILKVNDVWWWGKFFNGSGIYRFKNSDISSTDIPSGTGKEPASGAALKSVAVKALLYDSKRGTVYVTIPMNDDLAGLYAFPHDEIGNVKPDKLSEYLIMKLPPDSEGGENERIHITQMVLDNEDGSVYFAYRAPLNNPVILSGIKRYNPNTKKIESVIDGVEAYGISINNSKTQLF